MFPGEPSFSEPTYQCPLWKFQRTYLPMFPGELSFSEPTYQCLPGELSFSEPTYQCPGELSFSELPTNGPLGN